LDSPSRGNQPSNSAEDKALVNLITQTAKNSSYNNSVKNVLSPTKVDRYPRTSFISCSPHPLGRRPVAAPLDKVI
jgi:hypothetical protein